MTDTLTYLGGRDGIEARMRLCKEQKRIALTSLFIKRSLPRHSRNAQAYVSALGGSADAEQMLKLFMEAHEMLLESYECFSRTDDTYLQTLSFPIGVNYLVEMLSFCMAQQALQNHLLSEPQESMSRYFKAFLGTVIDSMEETAQAFIKDYQVQLDEFDANRGE